MGGAERPRPINSNFIMYKYRGGIGTGIGMELEWELALINSVDN
jgi:hypothetical protein